MSQLKLNRNHDSTVPLPAEDAWVIRGGLSAAFLTLFGLSLLTSCTPVAPASTGAVGKRGVVSLAETYAFTDFDSYERFFDTAQFQDQRVLTAMSRMQADGVMIPVRIGEPVTITAERSHTYNAFEVQLASGRRVWLSPKALRLDP